MIITTQNVAVIRNKDGHYLENSFNNIPSFDESLSKAIKYYDSQLSPDKFMSGRDKANVVVAKLGIEGLEIIDAELVHEIRLIEK